MSHSKAIGHRNLDYKPELRVAHKKQKDEGNAYLFRVQRQSWIRRTRKNYRDLG